MKALDLTNTVLKKEYLLMGLALGMAMVLFNKYMLFLAPLPIILALFFVYGRKAALFFIIATYLVLITDVVDNLRRIIVVLNTLYLVLIFFWDYGINLKAYPRLPSKVAITIFAFAFAMFISSLNSNYFVLGMFQLARFSVFVLIIYLIYAQIKVKEDVYLILKAILFSALFLSATILYEFYLRGFEITLFGTLNIFRVGGLFTNVNNVAVQMMVTAPILIALYPTFQKQNEKRIVGFLIFVLIAALIFNNSRGAIVAFGVSIFVLYYINNKRKAIITFSYLALFLLLAYLFTPVGDLIDLFFRVERFTSGREVLWQMAIEMFRQNPLTGVGPAGYKYEMYNFLPVMHGTWEELSVLYFFYIQDYGMQHNFFLYLASDLGLLGVAAGVILTVAFFGTAIKYFKENKNLNSRDSRLILGIYVVGYGYYVRSLFESVNIFSYGWLSGDLMFWLLFLVMMYLIEQGKIFPQKSE
ncbi:MAG: hypothetical protein C0425_08985 [Chlorobiaceae bacterium]|nr:hypothetical protein [Chlorobiaceae bacterium]MBA4310457.1 hypothetical protein [Chlorobiaceae bacterium]